MYKAALGSGGAVPQKLLGYFIFKESKNDTNNEICLTHSHIIAIIPTK